MHKLNQVQRICINHKYQTNLNLEWNVYANETETANNFLLTHLGFNVSADSAETTEALRRYLTNKKVGSH
jgi:hypothetical protein